jgi:MFS transporter, ACS family, hexuronate transporter
MANVLPSDLFASESVATVSGLGGSGAGLGTIFAFRLIGHFSDARHTEATHSFDPIILIAALVPLVGMILVLPGTQYSCDRAGACPANLIRSGAVDGFAE